MCGISGIYGIIDPVEAKPVVVKMNDRIAHRGPDDYGAQDIDFRLFG